MPNKHQYKPQKSLTNASCDAFSHCYGWMGGAAGREGAEVLPNWWNRSLQQVPIKFFQNMKEENISPGNSFTDYALHFTTSHWTTSSITCKILTVNSTKYFWLFSPTQLLTHGQWWSIFRMHLLQTLKEHRSLLTALFIPGTQDFTGVWGTKKFRNRIRGEIWT